MSLFGNAKDMRRIRSLTFRIINKSRILIPESLLLMRNSPGTQIVTKYQKSQRYPNSNCVLSHENVTMCKLYSNYMNNLWIHFLFTYMIQSFAIQNRRPKKFWIFVLNRLWPFFLEEIDLPEKFIWRIWMKIFVCYCENS